MQKESNWEVKSKVRENSRMKEREILRRESDCKSESEGTKG